VEKFSIYNKLKNILKIYRFFDWYYFLGYILIILSLVGFTKIDFRNIFYASLFIISCLSWGYSFNNLFDTSEDREFVGKNYFNNNSSMSLICTLLPCAIMLSISYAFGIFFKTLLVSLLNFVYSYPQIRLKKIAIFSLVINASLFSFMFYSASIILLGKHTLETYEMTKFIFIIFFPVQYIHILEHEGEQKKLKVKDVVFLLLSILVLIIFLRLNPSQLFNYFVLPISIYYFLFFIFYLITNSSYKLRNQVRILSIILGLVLFVQIGFKLR
jgi:4-hydroxybenzoate polyprenyltransferase